MNGAQSNPNLAQLSQAADKLKPLLGQIVFVGGCATGLLLTDPAAAPVRTTLDVDAIVELGSYGALVAWSSNCGAWVFVNRSRKVHQSAVGTMAF